VGTWKASFELEVAVPEPSAERVVAGVAAAPQSLELGGSRWPGGRRRRDGGGGGRCRGVAGGRRRRLARQARVVVGPERRDEADETGGDADGQEEQRDESQDRQLRAVLAHCRRPTMIRRV